LTLDKTLCDFIAFIGFYILYEHMGSRSAKSIPAVLTIISVEVVDVVVETASVGTWISEVFVSVVRSIVVNVTVVTDE
jgi:hypothetical protein